MNKVSIVWIRRDFRIQDNLALAAATENSDSVLLVFIVDPEQIETTASLNQSAFFASAKAFQANLANENIHLLVLKGTPESQFEKLTAALPEISDLYFNFDERGYGRQRDQQVAHHCQTTLGLKTYAYIDYNLHSANEIKKADGAGYQIFTPYFKRWITLPKPTPVKVSVTSLQEKQMANIEPLHLHQEGLLTSLINEKHDKQLVGQVGEAKALQTLKDFIQSHLAEYDTQRDLPFLDATSHLSRYLRTGEIAIRTIYQAVINEPESEGQQTFIKELAWRDYYNMIYAMNPQQNTQSLRSEFQKIAWRNNHNDFLLWQTGQTGFPIVDAAMRQLNQTGWMHNRLRMIVASFLTKDLLIDWRWGEQYFHDQLLDYDPASNIGGWQWAASTGTDSVPYFRIFNPTRQSQKFDPDGQFIKQFVPELSQITNDKIHEPQLLTDLEQKEFQVTLDKDYPKPMVTHKQARLRAIEVYEQSKDTVK